MEQTNKYNKRMSNAITWMRFPLIFLIIMLHCYSVVRIPGEHDAFFKIVYPFSLWLGETGVPGFFIISGYLFFLSKKSYYQRNQNRLFTLLIPYLLWNAAVSLPYIAACIIGYPQDINGKNMADYNTIDYIRLFWDRGSFDNGNFVPILCPLWYIRNLLVMSVLSPLFYYIIRYTREIFLTIITIWWMVTYDNAFIPQTILFFCLGSYCSIFNINPLRVISKHKPFFISFFLIFSFSDIISHVVISTPINLQLHRLSLIFNIPTLLLLADWCMRRGYYCKKLSDAAFIVFCVHYPIVVMIRKFSISKFTDVSDAVHILLYFVCVIIATLLSIGIFLLLERYIPNTKKILSGNR